MVAPNRGLDMEGLTTEWISNTADDNLLILWQDPETGDWKLNHYENNSLDFGVDNVLTLMEYENKEDAIQELQNEHEYFMEDTGAEQVYVVKENGRGEFWMNITNGQKYHMSEWV